MEYEHTDITHLTLPDFAKFPLTSLLAPFIALIRSPFATGPISSTILLSIHAFFTYGLICPSSPLVRPALIDLSDALSHLRFEGSDPSADEVVSFRLLNVIDIMMISEVGKLLGDVEVCELLELVLTICCQMRRGGTSLRGHCSSSETGHTLTSFL